MFPISPVIYLGLKVSPLEVTRIREISTYSPLPHPEISYFIVRMLLLKESSGREIRYVPWAQHPEKINVKMQQNVVFFISRKKIAMNRIRLIVKNGNNK
jgi:hypothetical protein